MIHIVPNLEGKWSVFISGLSRASRVFDYKQEAIDYAKIRSSKMKCDIYIHRNDGSVTQVIIFKG